MLRIRALLVSPFLLLAAAGCGRTASETPSSPEPRIVPVGDYRVTVEVENQNFYQATIYAYPARKPTAPGDCGNLGKGNVRLFVAHGRFAVPGGFPRGGVLVDAAAPRGDGR